MILDYFKEYCLNFKGVKKSLPFDQDILVLKVLGKMFSLNNIGKF